MGLLRRRTALLAVTALLATAGELPVNDKKEGYDTALWLVDADGSTAARPFTAGPRDLSPRWSPDGRWLAFTRAGEKEGKPREPQIHVIAADGGEARALTDLPKGAS